MSVFTIAREELAALLAESGGFPAYAYLPNQLSAPAAIVTPGSPYVTSGQTFGSVTVALKVRLLVQTGVNELATHQLDTALDAVLVALINGKYAVDEVTEPFMFGNQSGPQYMCAEINLTTSITL